ncbi:MAG: ParB/RepB/Spo0J family partition protein [Gammaproteobacteria bacterium]|nr:ParB/RepB/Spo0J family partition protein [Gammaproteobacteria bacterium]
MIKKKSGTPLSSKLSRDVFFGTSEDLPQIMEIDLADISPNPDQPRKTFNQQSLQELAETIAKHGLIQPITVKKADTGKGYVLVAGERRLRAFELLERTSIPAILTTGNSEEIALIENIQREDLDPLEEAEALDLMIERHRYTQEQLGAIIGKAQNTVSQTLSLLKLPPVVREQYKSVAHVNKSILSEIARIKDDKQQIKLWKQVAQGKLTTVKAARKGQVGRPKAADPLAETAVKTGKRFAQALETLEKSTASLDRESFQSLLEIHERIGTALNKISKN